MPATAAPPMLASDDVPAVRTLHLIGLTDPDRGEVEQYIRTRFLRAYGARVTAFMPALLVAWRQENVSAVVGLRSAASERLFIEHYFDEPVEARLSEATGRAVARNELLEIGNLVAGRYAGSQELMLLLPLLANALGYRWLVFTATPEVRKLVARLQFPLLSLAAADGTRLGTQRTAWGRYYDGRPQVMAGAVGPALAQIASCPALTAQAGALAPELARLCAHAQTCLPAAVL